MDAEKQKYGQNPLSEDEIKRLDRTVNYRIDNKMISELQKRNNEIVSIKENPIFMGGYFHGI